MGICCLERISLIIYPRSDLKIAGERARQVQRVLDVRQGELCWVSGTIYMDMPLKPNILDDISRDVCGSFRSLTYLTSWFPSLLQKY